MLHASTRKLIDRLAEMTELNKLDWSDAENGHINYATEGYSVSLTEGPNEVIITSKDGKELERANAEELAGTQNEDGIAYTAIVAAMTKEAARIARGTETAISTLLAGMQDAPAAEEESPIEEDAAVLQEDPVDETTVVAADTIATVAPKPEPVELENETETDAVPTEEETSDFVAAPFVSTETETAEPADTTEFEQLSQETIEAAPEFEPAPDAESETEVTEAVVRLADEVKQREDSGIDAATASAVGAVALAAGLTATQSEPESTEEAETEEEIHEEEIATAAFVATEEPEAATETTQYVPFGLNSEETSAPEPEPTVVETEAETSSESTSDTVVPFTTLSSVTPSFETNSEPTPEPALSPEPVLETALSEAALDTFVEPEPDASMSIEDMQVPTEPSLEPDAETTTGLSFESGPAAIEAPLTFSEEATAAAAESVSETQPAPEPEIAPSAPETPPASVDEVETGPVSPNQEAQSYSLSGIGAGFGLGALSAKTEASGIPGTNSGPGGNSEKVVIDATDDVLPKPEGNFNLPAGMSPVDPNNPSPETQAADENDDAASDILKPRTRFNPWD